MTAIDVIVLGLLVCFLAMAGLCVRLIKEIERLKRHAKRKEETP